MIKITFCLTRKPGMSRAALLADEATFIDLAGSPLWYGEEVEIFG